MGKQKLRGKFEKIWRKFQKLREIYVDFVLLKDPIQNMIKFVFEVDVSKSNRYSFGILYPMCCNSDSKVL